MIRSASARNAPSLLNGVKDICYFHIWLLNSLFRIVSQRFLTEELLQNKQIESSFLQM